MTDSYLPDNVKKLVLSENSIDRALAKSEQALANMQGRDVLRPAQMRSDLIDYFSDGGSQKGEDLPWEKMNETMKLRMGEVSIWAGVNGHGKSLLLGQVIAWQLRKHSALVASFEMKPFQTVGRMIQQIAGCAPSIEFMDQIINELEGRLYVFKQVKTVNADKVLALVHYGASELGIKHFVIDSLTKCGFRYDDYTGQTAFVDQLQCLAKEIGVHVHLVCHMTKPQNGATVGDKFGIRGAGGITDLADNVFIVSRNKIKEEVRRLASIPGHALSEHELKILEQGDAHLNIDKNREGGIEGKFALWFHGQSTQFLGTDSMRPMVPPFQSLRI